MEQSPDFVPLFGIAKEIQMVYLASCVQKFQGFQLHDLQQNKESSWSQFLYMQFLKKKTHPAQITKEEQEELLRFEGKEYDLCAQRGYDYVIKYMREELKEFHECRGICEEKYDPNAKFLNFASRSNCRRACEITLSKVAKQKVNDGQFPGVRELIKK